MKISTGFSVPVLPYKELLAGALSILVLILIGKMLTGTFSGNEFLIIGANLAIVSTASTLISLGTDSENNDED